MRIKYAAIFLLAGCAPTETTQMQLDRQTQETIKKAETGAGSFVIHQPATGCPEGWVELVGVFTKDGISRNACAIQKGGGDGLSSMDYIDAGEKYGMQFSIPLPPEPAPKERGKL